MEVGAVGNLVHPSVRDVGVVRGLDSYNSSQKSDIIRIEVLHMRSGQG